MKLINKNKNKYYQYGGNNFLFINRNRHRTANKILVKTLDMAEFLEIEVMM